MTQKHSCYRS